MCAGEATQPHFVLAAHVDEDTGLDVNFRDAGLNRTPVCCGRRSSGNRDLAVSSRVSGGWQEIREGASGLGVGRATQGFGQRGEPRLRDPPGSWPEATGGKQATSEVGKARQRRGGKRS